MKTIPKHINLDLSNSETEDLDIIKVKPKNSMGYSFVGRFVGIKKGSVLFQQYDYDKESIFDVELEEVAKKDRQTILNYL